MGSGMSGGEKVSPLPLLLLLLIMPAVVFCHCCPPSVTGVDDINASVVSMAGIDTNVEVPPTTPLEYSQSARLRMFSCEMPYKSSNMQETNFDL
ncbi:hypothetical protein LY76DRAFT_359766 [Colletotrichum caudatum]|nr:hypothetical protein LY76DRAFT_359766 [Colletotrichum caudatum]